MPLQLYELGLTELAEETRTTDENNPWRLYYSSVVAFEVYAENEAQARILASEQAGDEGAEAWINPKWSYCKIYEPLPPPEEPRVVGRDWGEGARYADGGLYKPPSKRGEG